MSSRFREIVAPREHGAWGMLAEPILAGCIVAPTWAGGAVCVAAVLGFLSRRAITVGWFVRAAQQDSQLKTRARVLGVALLAAALAILLAAAYFAADPKALVITVAVAAVLGLANFRLDRRKQGRSLSAELLGAWALTAIAPMVVFAGRVDIQAAVSIAALLGLRQTVSIASIRHRFRASRGMSTSPLSIWGNLALCIAVVTPLLVWDTIGWLAVLAVALLMARTIGMHLAGARPAVAKRIGLTELAIGLVYVLLISLDHVIG